MSRFERLIKGLFVTGIIGIVLCIVDYITYGGIDIGTLRYCIGIALGMYLGSGWSKE